jgi:hypothetical protein
MSQNCDSLHSPGSGLDQYRHVCVLYHGTDEEYQILNPFHP